MPAAASNVAAQTSSSETIDGTAKTSACQVSPHAVSPAAATGPTSSNQTGSASSSVARGAPPPLHVGGLPHTAERISEASTLQDAVVALSRQDPAASRVALPRSSSALGGHKLGVGPQCHPGLWGERRRRIGTSG